jgi:IS1 family transposase
VQNGHQRYRCKQCNRTFSDIPASPLEWLRVEPEKAYQVVQLLVEGVGIRAIERLTCLNRRTVLNILRVAGQKSARLLNTRIRNLQTEEIQADELVSFVYCKQQNAKKGDEDRGEFFTYLAVARGSKLIITWRTGKRTADNTEAFLDDLKSRLAVQPQLTTDGFQQYTTFGGGVNRAFNGQVHYATETKHFARPAEFLPREVIGITRKRRIGNPDLDKATICHTERTNLSVRLFTRRFTRCTLGYSKTLDNLRYAVALFIAHFNFCRIHGSLDKQTPAQAEGLTDHAWKIQELFTREKA